MNAENINDKSVYRKPEERVEFETPPRLSPEKAYFFEHKSSLKILEIGCSDIFIKKYFLSKGHEYVGFDLISNSADFNGDMNFLPFADKTFNAVLFNSTLQYSFNPNKTLKEINRVMTPNSFLTGSIAFLEPGIWKSLFHTTARGLFELLRYNNFNVRAIWPCWTVFEAIEIALQDDETMIEKTEILEYLARIIETDGHKELSENIHFAGGFNFYAEKLES